MEWKIFKKIRNMRRERGSYNDKKNPKTVRWGKARKSSKPSLCLSCLGPKCSGNPSSCPLSRCKLSGHSCLWMWPARQTFVSPGWSAECRLVGQQKRRGLSMIRTTGIVGSSPLDLPSMPHMHQHNLTLPWIPSPESPSTAKWGRLLEKQSPSLLQSKGRRTRLPKLGVCVQPTGASQLLPSEDRHDTNLSLWLLWGPIL